MNKALLFLTLGVFMGLTSRAQPTEGPDGVQIPSFTLTSVAHPDVPSGYTLGSSPMKFSFFEIRNGTPYTARYVLYTLNSSIITESAFLDYLEGTHFGELRRRSAITIAIQDLDDRAFILLWNDPHLGLMGRSTLDAVGKVQNHFLFDIYQREVIAKFSEGLTPWSVNFIVDGRGELPGKDGPSIPHIDVVPNRYIDLPQEYESIEKDLDDLGLIGWRMKNNRGTDTPYAWYALVPEGNDWKIMNAGFGFISRSNEFDFVTQDISRQGGIIILVWNDPIVGNVASVALPLGSTTSTAITNIEFEEEKEMFIFPNPAFQSAALVADFPGGHTNISLYDVLGREVQNVYSGELTPGRHQFVIDGTRLSAGQYLLKLHSGGSTVSKEVTFIK